MAIEEISPNEAAQRFEEAQSHLDVYDFYLPQGRGIIDYKPLEFSRDLITCWSRFSKFTRDETSSARVATLEREQDELKRMLRHIKTMNLCRE
jgi:hypothetical protein